MSKFEDMFMVELEDGSIDTSSWTIGNAANLHGSYYDSIRAWKCALDNDFGDPNAENLLDAAASDNKADTLKLASFLRALKCFNAKSAIALTSVLSTMIALDQFGGYEYNLPGTADCMANIKYSKKVLNGKVKFYRMTIL